jgi:surfeit locus 1 family protein
MKLPVIPTLIVALAVATMIGLGIWQLRRADEKKAQIARFEAASGLPPVSWPVVPPKDDALLYRRATGYCLSVTGWRAVAGRNQADEAGWAHIAACRTGMEGPGMQADMGWSKQSDAPAWKGGPVEGVIVPDRLFRLRLVAATPAPGLQASAAPSPRDLPDNHLLYAFQWFFFAATAAIIYVLALRRRRREASPA